MTDLLALMLATMIVAAASGVAVAWRRREYVPAAVALVALAVANVVQVAIGVRLSPYPDAPWTGLARVLVYIDAANTLAAAEIVPALALSVTLSGRQRRLALACVAVSWGLSTAVLCALYPSPVVRGRSLERLYLAADLVCLTIASGAIIARVRVLLERRQSPRPADAIALALVALDVGILLAPHSPWRDAAWTSPLGRFDIIQAGIILFFAAFAAVHGVLWKLSRS